MLGKKAGLIANQINTAVSLKQFNANDYSILQKFHIANDVIKYSTFNEFEDEWLDGLCKM